MMYTRYFLCKFYYPLALARKENWTKNVHCIFCTNVRQIDEKIDVKIIMSGGTGIFHQLIILKPLCMTFKVFSKLFVYVYFQGVRTRIWNFDNWNLTWRQYCFSFQHMLEWVKCLLFCAYQRCPGVFGGWGWYTHKSCRMSREARTELAEGETLMISCETTTLCFVASFTC